MTISDKSKNLDDTRGLPSLPFCQEKEDEIFNLHSANEEPRIVYPEDYIISTLFQTGSSVPCSETITTVDEFAYLEAISLSTGLFLPEEETPPYSLSSARMRSVPLTARITAFSKSVDQVYDYQMDYKKNCGSFGKKEMVYMTLCDELCRQRTSGTQATASVNKCLQVSCKNICNNVTYSASNAVGWDSTSNTTYPDDRCEKNIIPEQCRNSEIYFFGRKNHRSENVSDMGMGCSGLKRKKPRSAGSTSYRSNEVQAKSPSSTTGVQTKDCCGKAVSIKDPACIGPACVGTADMLATISHIKIAPKEPCPIHGMAPCQGPKCMVMTAAQDEQAPVKITTSSNPRRGVFELVIRRMTGAPLAKNELMLEWTPPPGAPPPCPSSTMCSRPVCRPRCKLRRCRITCRPKSCKKSCKKPKPCCLPCRKPCGPPCRKPCGPPCRSPCGPPCRSPCGPPCRSPCGPPCRSPCGPPCRKPCGPPCRSPCGPPCKTPCGSPCVKPCGPPCRRPCGPPCRKPCGPPCRKPCRPRCRRSCGPPCGVPCGTPCGSTCGSICGPPCGPPSCGPPCGRPCGLGCPVVPCKPSPGSCKKCCQPCAPEPCIPCTSVCKSSPCLRPCPIGYKKPRRSRSQPKIKAHKIKKSPCHNRSPSCPVARCCSGPCIKCCGPTPCSKRKCSKIFRCPTVPCCKSACSSTCI